MYLNAKQPLKVQGIIQALEHNRLWHFTSRAGVGVDVLHVCHFGGEDHKNQV